MTGPVSGPPERRTPNSVGDAYVQAALPLAQEMLERRRGNPLPRQGVIDPEVQDFLTGPVLLLRHLLADFPALVIPGNDQRGDWLALRGALEEALEGCKRFTPPEDDVVESREGDDRQVSGE